VKIEDRDERPTDQTAWDLYVQRVGEPKRFEDWKSKAFVFGSLALLAAMAAVGLYLFLGVRVG